MPLWIPIPFLHYFPYWHMTGFSLFLLSCTVQIQYHRPNHILVFDDSKPHRAFNNSPSHTRTVLIVDLWRPLDVPRGTATGSHTQELDGFVSQFK